MSTDDAQAEAAGDAQWREALAEYRAWWDTIYTGEDSPLSAEEQADFAGLNWFPPDPAYRVEGVRLERHPAPKPAPLHATGEEAVEFLEVGVMRFTLHGEPCALTVYEPAEGQVEETYLFIPFQDATSAKETYGGGRYLDFEPADDDVYTLDFNRAYHPYCVHAPEWSCTLPPPENRLSVPVRAGERL